MMVPVADIHEQVLVLHLVSNGLPFSLTAVLPQHGTNQGNGHGGAPVISGGSE